MPVWTQTLTFLGVVTAGLYVTCASVLATAGYSAPACIASGIASGIGLILSVFNDGAGRTVTNANNPEHRRRADGEVRWLKVHDNGTLERFDDRMHEFYGTTMTHLIFDAQRGWQHTLTTIKSGYTRVTTDLHQKDKTKARRQAESPSSASSRRGRPGMSPRMDVDSLRKLFTRTHPNSLDYAAYQAQKIGSVKDTPDSDGEMTLGQEIINHAIHIGKYCVTMKHDGTAIADMGLTFGKVGSTPSDDEPPCKG